MPELPEVETVVRGLRERIVGRRIEAIWLRRPKSAGVAKGNLRAMERYLQGGVLEGVGRRAKYILMTLAEPANAVWGVHLGMTGQLYACLPDAERLPHTHLVAELSGGEQLRLVDSRRFGKTFVLASAEVEPYFAGVGPDPFEIPAGEFRDLLAGRKAPIKNLLLNQGVIAGVGNIYANEALFLAGIHPATPAGRIEKHRAILLHRMLRKVLRDAIRGNGTTIADYRTSEGAPGWYQNRLRVYDREGEPCPRCGRTIRRLVLSQRSAQYCPGCQRKSRPRRNGAGPQ